MSYLEKSFSIAELGKKKFWGYRSKKGNDYQLNSDFLFFSGRWILRNRKFASKIYFTRNKKQFIWDQRGNNDNLNLSNAAKLTLEVYFSCCVKLSRVINENFYLRLHGERC